MERGAGERMLCHESSERLVVCAVYGAGRCAGTAFGGWKTRDAIPMLVEKTLKGEIPLEHFITYEFSGVAGTVKALEALHSGDCLRAVVTY